MANQSFLLSLVLSFDSTSTNHDYLREYVVHKVADQAIKFDQSVFVIKMVMIQASEHPLHIGFKVRRQTFSQGVR
jgi:hypothetical protein